MSSAPPPASLTAPVVNDTPTDNFDPPTTQSGDTSSATEVPKQAPFDSGTVSASGKASYTSLDDEIIIDILTEHRGTFQTDSGWKAPVWGLVLAALKEKGSNRGGPKTAAKVNDHQGELKKRYNNLVELRKLSGFGWDDAQCRVTASEEVWDALLATSGNTKKYERFRTGPFPLFKKISLLYNGIVADGRHVVSGGTATGVPSARNITASDPPAGLARSSSAPVVSDSGDTSIDSGTTVPNHNKEFKNSPLYGGASAKQSHSKATERSTPQSRSTQEVANAIGELCSVLQAKEDTPTRRKRAIKLFEEDGEISDDEAAEAYELFRNITYADTYVSISPKRRRTRYISTAIRKAQLAEQSTF